MKDFRDTCYYKDKRSTISTGIGSIGNAATTDGAPCTSNINSESFKLLLDNTVDHSFPAEVLEEIGEIYVKHSSINNNQTDIIQLAMLDVIKYFHDLARKENSLHSSQRTTNSPHPVNSNGGTHPLSEHGHIGNINCEDSSNENNFNDISKASESCPNDVVFGDDISDHSMNLVGQPNKNDLVARVC